MQGSLYYKKYIEKLINANPTTLTIKRITKVDDGYGGHTTTESTHDETVTFYQRRSNREFVSDSGVSVGWMATSIEKILAKATTDIVRGDKFIANDREYRVTFVQPYFDICKQIEVEVIENEP